MNERKKLEFLQKITIDYNGKSIIVNQFYNPEIQEDGLLEFYYDYDENGLSDEEKKEIWGKIMEFHDEFAKKFVEDLEKFLDEKEVKE
jgi:hypothetical protein